MSDHCGALCIIGLIAVFLVLGLVFYLEDLVVILIVNSNIFIVIVAVIVLIVLYICSQTEYHSGYSIFFPGFLFLLYLLFYRFDFGFFYSSVLGQDKKST